MPYIADAHRLRWRQWPKQRAAREGGSEGNDFKALSRAEKLGSTDSFDSDE
jgi:hypothetical protein